jgi:NH3-dependent NAD+ synthetase
MNAQKTVSTLIEWIVATTPRQAKVLIPVSGGSDSALCFWLYSKALPGRAEGVYIGTDLRCKDWFEQYGTVRYSDLKIVGPNPEIERWTHFLTIGVQEDMILVGSRNRTEDTFGTFSHASKVCSFLPLVNIWKSQVMELSEHIDMPDEILASSKRADPECGRPKRMSDIAFKTVDYFLQAKLGDKDTSSFPGSSEQLAYLEDVYAHQAYKKNLPLKGPTSISNDSSII